MTRTRTLVTVLTLAAAGLLAAGDAGAFITVTNGYFHDPDAGTYWVPRGFAYQTINPAVGATQSLAQLKYDMLEMRKMHADSIRVDFTWGVIEPTQGNFDFSMADEIVAEAARLGFRLFPLIGYQYPPGWFSSSWKAIDASNNTANLLNYEHPEARAAFSNFIAAVTAHYKDSPTVAGWILGNEFAYFDLWDYTASPHLFVGFDATYSLPAFRAFLTNLYDGSIATLNANWQTNYASFNDVVMPRFYPTNRYCPAYHDLIQWRKQSVGDFIAVGAAAAKAADTNHLISYSMVGGIYNGFDANNTCEDTRAIVERCEAAGAPLDFWAINNYPWTSEGNELRSARFGIARHQDQSGLPVLVTETGYSSTDDIFTETLYRQANALPGSVWEALMAGAAGIHIFTWNDRRHVNLSTREEGFGIMQRSRLPKGPVYWNILETFRRMEQLHVGALLGGSLPPSRDLQFLWSTDSDLVWPSANQENAMFWGGMKRLGYEPRFIDGDEFDDGAWSNAPALILSRCYQLAPERLDAIVSNVIPAGIHVYANADLPGRFNAYHQSNTAWAARMNQLFGLNTTNAQPAWHGGAYPIGWPGHMQYVALSGANALGPISNTYGRFWMTWEIWNGVYANAGTTIITQTGFPQGSGTFPALHILSHPGGAKAAANTIALGEIGAMLWESWDNNTSQTPWNEHYDWCRAVLRDGFGLEPQVDISGSGRFYVIPDYRTLANGSVLIALMNESTNSATITVTATNLMKGLTVEQLSPAAGVLEANSDGQVSLTLSGDGYILLYAYTNNNSLANPSAYKVWVEDAPLAFWPNQSGDIVRVGYDTRGSTLNLHLALEQVDAAYTNRGATNALSVSGIGTNALMLVVKDADLGDATYRSSFDGGEYVLHAWLADGATAVSHTYLPARLLWGVRPAALPTSIVASSTYDVTLGWQELPSYLGNEHPTPLNRADVWSGNPDDTEENYLVSLHLLASNGTEVARNLVGTSEGTDSNTVSITTPGTLANPPYSWKALLTAAGPKFGGPIHQSFETAAQGGHDIPGSGPEPWQLDSGGTGETYLNRGTDSNASEGLQSSWQAYQSHAPGGSSYYYLRYVYPRPFAITNGLNNVRFSFDFFEDNGLACGLEMHVKDNAGNMLRWTNLYVHTPGNWHTNSATLDQFSGTISTAAVREIVVVVTMLQASQTYVGHIDNIRFDADDAIYRLSGDPVYDVVDGFENYTPGAGTNITHPWAGFFYADPGLSVYWVEGVDAVASFEGAQSAFLLGQILPGATYSGHGFGRTYTNAWALPAASAWSNISFQFTYRETNMVTGDLLLKLEDNTGGAIEYRAAYTGGWQTIRATLNQFTLSAWPNYFDPNNVKKLVVLLDSKTFNGTYYSRFDDIRFLGADTTLGLGAYTGITERAWYLSINDSGELADTDNDGVPDIYETNTGVWNGPTDTGTDPNDADSDDDGLKDGDEVIAGTNPNDDQDFFQLADVGSSPSGMLIEWLARTGRVYAIHHLDGSLVTDSFQPLGTWSNITVVSDGYTNVVDDTAGGTTSRFYRITVRSQ